MGHDMSVAYGGYQFSAHEVTAMVSYLLKLHECSHGTPLTGFQNQKMKELNHFHIYDFPLQKNNGLEFSPDLQNEACFLKSHDEYKNIVRELGNEYLSDGPTLLHGDFFSRELVFFSGEAVCY